MGRCTNRPRSIQFTGVKVKADSTLYKPEDSSLSQGYALWSRSSGRIQDRKTEVEWKDENKPRAAPTALIVYTAALVFRTMKLDQYAFRQCHGKLSQSRVYPDCFCPSDVGQCLVRGPSCPEGRGLIEDGHNNKHQMAAS